MFFVVVECNVTNGPWSCGVKAIPNSIQIDFEFKSNQMPWWIIKNNVENKHCPKILLPLIINSKYSVDHDPPSWRF